MAIIGVMPMPPPSRIERLGIGGQREQVARVLICHLVPFQQGVVHAHRATAGGRVFQHAKAIHRGIGRVAAQRILAHQARGDMDVHMRARLEGRQRRAIGQAQVEHDHVGPLDFALAHDYVQQLFIHGRCPA
jgi:hypothetical protein